MYKLEEEFKSIVEIEKTGEEPLCLQAPNLYKAKELSLALDIINTELKLGLKITLHITDNTPPPKTSSDRHK